MAEVENLWLSVGEAAQARRIAILSRRAKAPPVVWLGGFKSDMVSTKAAHLDAWAQAQGQGLPAFRLFGPWRVRGPLRGRHDRTLARGGARRDRAACPGRDPLLVGSSMGGWIALLAARQFGEASARASPGMGLVLIAPAVDFTQELMWKELSLEARRDIEEKGVYLRPSAYSPEPYPITRDLIEEGRRISCSAARSRPAVPSMSCKACAIRMCPGAMPWR